MNTNTWPVRLGVPIRDVEQFDSRVGDALEYWKRNPNFNPDNPNNDEYYVDERYDAQFNYDTVKLSEVDWSRMSVTKEEWLADMGAVSDDTNVVVNGCIVTDHAIGKKDVEELLSGENGIYHAVQECAVGLIPQMAGREAVLDDESADLNLTDADLPAVEADENLTK